MTDTAEQIITKSLRLFGIIDQTEDPTPDDITNNLPILSDLLRSEQSDGACQYTISMVEATLPAGVSGSVYSFFIGTASAAYLVQQDAVAVRAIWMNDISSNVNRETRMAPKADVVRTTYPGIVTKWHQERQSDGSVKITAWQPPRTPARALIEIGGRLPALTAGADVVPLPPEGIHDASLLLGRRIFGSYGKSPNDVAVILGDANAVNARWRDYARGQQWLRFVRS